MLLQLFVQNKSCMRNGPVRKSWSSLQRINDIDMGMLHNVRETLCIGLDEERKVNGKYRDLQELFILMAKFYFTRSHLQY